MTLVEALREMLRSPGNTRFHALVDKALPLAEAQERRIVELEAALKTLLEDFEEDGAICYCSDLPLTLNKTCAPCIARAALHPAPEPTET